MRKEKSGEALEVRRLRCGIGGGAVEVVVE